jgi:electron transfer flavoprotein beta subunit
MRIAVCLKQVPDIEGRLKLASDGRWIDEEDLPFVLNESDEYAVEEALQQVEKHDGEVVVFTLGPDRATEALRKALALGAGRAVHLADEAFQGGDPLSTARALAAAIKKEGPFDLVLTGSQSSDVGYGATGSVLAALLDLPHAWLVMGLEVEGDKAQVVREMEGGLNERHALAMPCVLEVQAGINTPRYASLKGIMQAKRKPVDELTPGDLELDPGTLGAAGARLETISVAFPDAGAGAEILEGEPQAAARALVEKLRKEARVL